MLELSYSSLYALAERLSVSYRSAEPFPHVVIDGLFNAQQYSSLVRVFPDPKDPIWKKPENSHVRGKFVTRGGDFQIKDSLYSDDQKQLLRELNSALFLRFLEKLTGIEGLISDPYFVEAGFHCSEDGGFLDIHADFSHHDIMKIERRLNLLIYINNEWKEDFGGSLSLYDRNLQPVISIEPVGNRCVVFETSPYSFHGHPQPMKLPAETYRKSIALYYYSAPRINREVKKISFPEDPNFEYKPTIG
jgi:hypothetical protein